MATYYILRLLRSWPNYLLVLYDTYVHVDVQWVFEVDIIA